jgi:hypothetical protein
LRLRLVMQIHRSMRSDSMWIKEWLISWFFAQCLLLYIIYYGRNEINLFFHTINYKFFLCFITQQSFLRCETHICDFVSTTILHTGRVERWALDCRTWWVSLLPLYRIHRTSHTPTTQYKDSQSSNFTLSTGMPQVHCNINFKIVSQRFNYDNILVEQTCAKIKKQTFVHFHCRNMVFFFNHVLEFVGVWDY